MRKTIAIEAEKKRKLELERRFNGIADARRGRIRSLSEIAVEFLQGYRLRNPRSATFADYAVGHGGDALGDGQSSSKTAMISFWAGGFRTSSTQ
jgi:hypothetical protein